MRWILRGMMLLVAVAVLAWGQDKEYGTWSAGFLLAAWVMLEPRIAACLDLAASRWLDRYRHLAMAAALVMRF